MMFSSEAGVADGEPLLRIGPGLDLGKARKLKQRTEVSHAIFVAALGMDALARSKAACPTRPLHGGRMTRFKVHFDARAACIEQRAMAPVTQFEVALNQRIQMVEDVQIERGRNAQSVVVSRFKD